MRRILTYILTCLLACAPMAHAADIGDATPWVKYTATASQTVFPYSFVVFDEDDLVVYQNGTALTISSDYTVSGVGSEDGGNVTLLTGATADDEIVIASVPNQERTSQYTGSERGFTKELLDDDFNRIVAQVQRNRLAALRCPARTLADWNGTQMSLPEADETKVLGWNETTGQLANVDPDAVGTGADALNAVIPGGSRTVTTMQTYLANNALINVRDYGATGDGATDDLAAIELALASAATDAQDSGGRIAVYFPPGTYRITELLDLVDNVHIINEGTIYFDGDETQGAVIRSRGHDNWIWDGGIIDCNNVGNTNGIGHTGHNFCGGLPQTSCNTNADCTGGGTGVCDLDPQDDIRIQNVTVKNCASGEAGGCSCCGAAPGSTGDCGGKGLSVQHGPNAVTIDNVLVDNCDLGISVEGQSNYNGRTQNVVITNAVVRDAQYAGLYLFGSSTVVCSSSVCLSDTGGACSTNSDCQQDVGDTFNLILDNIHLENCSTDEEADFGAITAISVHGMLARNIFIRNPTGTVTPFRGTMRESDLEFRADVYTLEDLLDFTVNGGANGSAQPSRLNKIRADVKVRDSSSGVGGFLLTYDDAGGNALSRSDLDLTYMVYDGSDMTDNAWSGPGQTCSALACSTSGVTCATNADCSPYFEFDPPSTLHWRIANLSDGSVIEGQGIDPLDSDNGKWGLNGAYIQLDPSTMLVKFSPAIDGYGSALANDAGQSVIKSVAAGAKAGLGFIWRDTQTLADDATPSVDGGNLWTTGGTTAITDFDDAVDGQQITVVAAHSVTITNGTPIKLNGGSNFAMAAGDTLTLISDGTTWYETGRSDNTP